MRRLVHSVKVDGDAKRHSDLICPGVAPSNGSRRVVDFVGHPVPGQCLSLERRRKRNVKQSRTSLLFRQIVVSNIAVWVLT